jgi:hypothetical protein
MSSLAIAASATPYVIASIALLSSLLSASLALWGQARTQRVTAHREAEAVLRKYREPLVGAAYELQSRLYNILELEFMEKYFTGGDEWQRTYARENTLYVVGQYFGWSEILRREIQLLAFSDSEQTRSVAKRQRSIVEIFQDDDEALGSPFLLWRGEQRAIGELMIDPSGGEPRCLGYATFLDRREPEFRRWFARLETDLDAVAAGPPNKRIVDLQHALVDLIRELDPEGMRYSDDKLGKV